MNNSEFTTIVSPDDAFAPRHTHVYPFPRDKSVDKSLKDGGLRAHRSIVDGDVAVGYLKTAAGQEASGAQKVEACSQNGTDRPDRGFWLLRGSVIRHDRWDGLREFSTDMLNSDEFTLSRSPGMTKRVCDIVGSLFLLTMLSPLFPLIALAIKLDSPGPVFFRHSRVGKNGKHFVLWKFRSMRTDVPQYASSPRNAKDVRLTRVGRLIRRLSIDEIPQLINVLRGEMSLVGPRPEMPFIVELFHDANSNRLSVTPGITGLWQISPARAFPIHENLQYDHHYVRNQNLVLDCVIILRTIAAVIHGVGAV
jgi:lipopolysaccharide/colanic/teichoic acid biosynthesis glycosyltransferase